MRGEGGGRGGRVRGRGVAQGNAAGGMVVSRNPQLGLHPVAHVPDGLVDSGGTAGGLGQAPGR